MTSKNNKKRRRRALLIPLLFSTFFLITTTYAWFSANRMVNVESLNVHVQTEGGLEVSTNAIDWKQVVNVQDIMDARNKYATSVNQIPYEMSPVSTGGNTSNGKMAMFLGNATSNDDGDFVLVADPSVETESFGESSDGEFIVFDVFFRVKANKELYIDGDSKVEYTGDRTNGIENATRIAFVVEGNSADEPSISQALNNANSVIFWEPNYDVHTVHGVDHARNTYGITTTQTGGTPLPYSGVTSSITLANGVLVSNATENTYPSFFKNMNMDITTPLNGATNQKILDLTPSVTKVRIYIWIEGQDVDCEDYASYGDITFDMKFTTDPS